MKILIKDRLERFGMVLLLFGSMSLAFSVIIQATLFISASETNFLLTFLFTFVLPCGSILIALLFNIFRSWKYMKNLSKEWNIPIYDVIEGVYSYEIQNYWMMNATQFSEILNTARSKDEIDKKNSYA